MFRDMKRVNNTRNKYYSDDDDDFEDDLLTSRKISKKKAELSSRRNSRARSRVLKIKSPCCTTVEQKNRYDKNQNSCTPGTSQYSSPSRVNYLGIGSGSISHDELKQPSKLCGYCPICQMPFTALQGDTPRGHVTECIGCPVESQTECHQGISCSSSSPSHYRKFKHSELAEYHSRPDLCTTEESFSQKEDDISPEGVQGVSASDMDFSSNNRHDPGETTANTDPCLEVSHSSIEPSLRTEASLSVSESDQTASLPRSQWATSPQKRKTSRRWKPTKKELTQVGQRSILEFFPCQNLHKKPTNLASQDSKASNIFTTDSNSAAAGVSTLPASIKSGFLGNNFRNSERLTLETSEVKKNKAKHSTRSCPFYKRIPGTPFTVDAFSYGTIPDCAAYFLTHFHYDHYQGLTKTFSHPIYCSKITANLVEKKIRINRTHLHHLDIDKVYYIENVEVTLLDANHCPGSVMVLFKLKSGQVILHTGDFRASDSMQGYAALKGLHVNKLFLDTTYCDPYYCFPSQQSVIDFAIKISTTFIRSNQGGVVVVGSYTIGKERIFLAISEALDCKICVSSEKKRVLSCLDDQSILKRLTLNPREAKVHVLPMNKLSYKGLSSYLLEFNFEKVLAFEPTGWTHTEKPYEPKVSKNGVTLYGVPYSEHSSFEEMKKFVCYLHPDKIIPTVNNSHQSVKKMEKYFTNWLSDTSH